MELAVIAVIDGGGEGQQMHWIITFVFWKRTKYIYCILKLCLSSSFIISSSSALCWHIVSSFYMIYIFV